MPARILLVTSRQAGASALPALIAEAGFRLAGVAAWPEEVMNAVRRELPDAILIDMDAPRPDTLESMARLQRSVPVPVLLLTECEDRPFAHAALHAGIGVYAVAHPAAALLRSLIEVTLSQHRARIRLQSELTRAAQRLEENSAIDRARCLLMEQYRLSEREAFARLRRLAMDRRQRLVDAAQALLNQAAA